MRRRTSASYLKHWSEKFVTVSTGRQPSASASHRRAPRGLHGSESRCCSSQHRGKQLKNNGCIRKEGKIVYRLFGAVRVRGVSSFAQIALCDGPLRVDHSWCVL